VKKNCQQNIKNSIVVSQKENGGKSRNSRPGTSYRTVGMDTSRSISKNLMRNCGSSTGFRNPSKREYIQNQIGVNTSGIGVSMHNTDNTSALTGSTIVSGVTP
jgi:hypothetical protein